MVKPKQVYKWIQNRYEYYDKKENRYCGEKYTKQVFEDAGKYFKLPAELINELYNQGCFKYISKVKIKKNNKVKEKFAKILNKLKNKELKATKLNNKKVKINVDKILKDKNRNNPKFLDFINLNKDIIFTAITDKKMDMLYTFKENDTWTFFEDDLIEVK